MQIRRIQYPVGQGCFHAGDISWEEEPSQESREFRYIYDCGSTKQRALREAINIFHAEASHVDALFVSHLDSDHVNGLDRLLSSVTVDTVFIPYVDNVVPVLDIIEAELDGTLTTALIEANIDPQAWFGRRGVSRVVRVLGSKPGGPNDRQEIPEFNPESAVRPSPRYKPLTVNSGDILSVGGQQKNLGWVLVPHVDPALPEQRGKFNKAMRAAIGLLPKQRLTAGWLAEALRNSTKREKLRGCYEEIISGGSGRNHNRVSMSLYSGPAQHSNKHFERRILPPHHTAWLSLQYYTNPFLYRSNKTESVGWIGTGDAKLDIKKVRAAWEVTYRPFRNQVSTLLLPHHGSRHNYHHDLLDFPNLNLCIASAGDPSQYGHPGIRVVRDVLHQQKRFHHVSQRTHSGIEEYICLS